MDLFCFVVTFTVLFANVLYISAGVGGCEWPIFDRSVHMDVTFWKFSNNPLNSASLYDSMKFLMILHSTCSGPFSEGIYFIGVLNLVWGKNIHLLCSVPLVLRFRMHINIYVYSFRFFCILLLHPYVTHCNLITLWSVLQSLLLSFHVLTLGSLVPLTL